MQNRVVSNDEWTQARLELLAAEKEFTRADAPHCQMSLPGPLRSPCVTIQSSPSQSSTGASGA
jgi:hypothetical protein